MLHNIVGPLGVKQERESEGSQEPCEVLPNHQICRGLLLDYLLSVGITIKHAFARPVVWRKHHLWSHWRTLLVSIPFELCHKPHHTVCTIIWATWPAQPAGREAFAGGPG